MRLKYSFGSEWPGDTSLFVWSEARGSTARSLRGAPCPVDDEARRVFGPLSLVVPGIVGSLSEGSCGSPSRAEEETGRREGAEERSSGGCLSRVVVRDVHRQICLPLLLDQSGFDVHVRQTKLPEGHERVRPVRRPLLVHLVEQVFGLGW